MSAKISGPVWDLDLDPVEKFVLLAYADHADHHGRNVRPGIRHVAYKTGLSPRQVQRVTQKLIARGYLVPVLNLQGGRGKAVEYRIDFSQAIWSTEEEKEKGDTHVTLSQEVQTTIALIQQGSLDVDEADALFRKDDTYVTLSANGDTHVTLSATDGLKGDTKGDTQDAKGDIAMSPQPSDPKPEPTPPPTSPSLGEVVNPLAAPGGGDGSAAAPDAGWHTCPSDFFRCVNDVIDHPPRQSREPPPLAAEGGPAP